MRPLLVIELLGLRAGQSMPGAQGLGDAPGLGTAAARGMRRIAVEDFTDCSDTGLSKVCGDAAEEGERVRRVAINPLVCDCKGTQQPAPHRALVVAGVALARAAAVVGNVGGVRRLERAQSERCQQQGGADIDYGALLVRFKQVGAQRNGKQLVRAHAGMDPTSVDDFTLRAVDHVVHAPATFAPESRAKPSSRGPGSRAEPT